MLGLDNPLHILILLVIVLLVFGAKRLPEMGKSLGTGMRGFKDALSGEDTSDGSAPTASLAAAQQAPAADVPAQHQPVGRPEHTPAA